jgi:hypothetical protein
LNHQTRKQIFYLNKIPVLGRLGNLIRDWAASISEENQFLRAQMNHIEERFQANSGITLERKSNQ